MKTRLVALFLLLLLLPLGLALWLGLRSLEDGQASALTQARAVWSGPLEDLRARVRAFVQGVEEGLRADTPGPLVRTRFLIRGGEVERPARYQSDGTADPFFIRTAALWDRRFWERGSGERPQSPTAGWVSWTSAEGPGFLYWYRDGDIVRGAELAAWPFLSLLSSELPELNWSDDQGAVRALVLRDASGGEFHRWGRWEAGDSEPVINLSLTRPFEGWAFELFLAPEAFGESQNQWVWLFILVGLGLSGIVAVGAWVFVRTLGASLAEASQRVRFVNQVSHELKTPLTNILLYGELLEGALDSPPRAREYLEIIRGESGRLGRLITNVLTFARRDLPDLPRTRPLVWDEAIEGILKLFRPGLADRGLVLEWIPGAPVAGEWDPDWLGQILGNLVSNAEKYAGGGRVEVSTGASETEVWLRVADQGPGIPSAAAEKVFLPFARLDDRLTSGAAGTGLGLGIARDLARRHGGDLVLEARGPGAHFLLTLPRGSRP